MKKYLILNIALNLAIVFFAYSIFTAFQGEGTNQIFLFISIALLVVLVYLKVVLFKFIRKNVKQEQQHPNPSSNTDKRKTKK